MRLEKTLPAPLILAVTALSTSAAAGVVIYEDGDRYAEIGGQIQVQYRRVEPDRGERVDDLFLRRFRVTLQGTVTEDVYGVWQVDFGGSGGPTVKDAFIQYLGLPFGELKLGNRPAPFSREQLTSSRRQQLVERQFVGDNTFGVPDDQVGLTWSGKSQLLAAAVGVYHAGVDEGFDRVEFESRATDDPFYFGHMLAARLDYNPLGHFDMGQGAFGSERKLGFGVNAYTWSNDGDLDVDDPANAVDVDGVAVQDQYDSIRGVGIDGAVRSGYLSVDAAYQAFSAEVKTGNAAGVGIVGAGGDAEFDTYLVKAGYMILPDRLEAVAAWSGLDADQFENADTRLSIGGNYFLNRHDAKIQVTYEIGRDVGGVRGRDRDTLYVQFQQVL